MDTITYFRQKGEQAKQMLIDSGCKQCSACQLWMDKKYVSQGGICDECSETNLT